MANPINPATGKEYTYAELVAQIETLKAQQNAARAITYHVNQEKGGIGIFGFNKQFPITLYAEHLSKLNDLMPEILAFAKRHEAILAQKADDDATKAAKLAKRVKLANDKTADTVTKLPVVKVPGKAPVAA
jgi:hypothetical protein